VSICYIFTLRGSEQGFTFPVAELFLEDVLEKTSYKINSERDNFADSSRRKRFSSV
jgi:ATP-dependent RNA helicase DHX36